MSTVPNHPPEREPLADAITAAYTGEIPIDAPEPIHYHPGTLDQLSPCQLNLGEVAAAHQTTNPALATCAICSAAVAGAMPVADKPGYGIDPVVAQLYGQDADDVLLGELRQAAAIHDPAPAFADLAPEIGPAEPPSEQRTVGLEVLTDELFQQETDRRDAEANGGRFERLPDDARVAVVLRANGELVAIEDTDATWRKHIPNMPTYILSRLLEQVGNCAVGGLVGIPDVKALMPTPDVLAALAGRPVGAYTAAVGVRFEYVQPGWLVLVETVVSGVGSTAWLLVEHVEACAKPGLCLVAQGDSDCCVVVTIRGRGVQHLETWRPVQVRIPATNEVEAQ